MNYYIDSSALVKLLVQEEESSAMRSLLGNRFFTSVLTRVEVSRALARAGLFPNQITREYSDLLNFLPFNEVLIESIEKLPFPKEVRSLDSIHIGSAHLVSAFIQGVITYDKTMQKSLNQLGITWLAPKAASKY